MKKINLLFSILLLLFPKAFLYSKPFSNLLEYVREDLTNRVIVYLPQRTDSNLLDLCFHLLKLTKSYSLNKMETAYIIYTWIHRNIMHDCSDNLKYIKTPETIFDTGKGGPNGISLLFKTMCNHLEIEAGIISGYIKFMKKIV